MTKKIIFSTGGTGGHIFPAINLMKHFFSNGHKVLLVTDVRGNNFIKNYSEFKSYILKSETLTNKNFFKKILSSLVIFYKINYYFKKGKTRFNFWVWRLCIFSNLFCIKIF